MIGIDFGTTNSAIAHVVAGEKPVPIADPDTNQVILPSFVHYESPSRVIVGEEAKAHYYELYSRNSGKIFKSIKRRLKEGRTFNIFGKPVPDVEIASHIFAELKRRAENIRKERVEDAVVTIPVYFDADQRKSVRKAAELGGLNIKNFLHEPVAVAFKKLKNIKYTQNVMVFDWGGGTLDISLLRVNGGMISEIEVGGDEELGGDDIDRCLSKDTLEWFFKDTHIRPFKLEDNPSCMQRLLTRSETAKIQLSDPLIPDTSIDIPAFYMDQDLSRFIGRSEYEGITKTIYDEAVGHIHRVLTKVKLRPGDVDRIFLAGGSSRMPCLVRAVEVIFGTAKINTSLNTDTCVAEGAALVAFQEIEPVLAVPIGIEFEDGFIYKFLEKGISLSHPQTDSIQLLVTDPRSGKANIKIYESESGKIDAYDTRIKELLSVPVNPECAENVHVKFELDENQCLTIDAVGMSTGVTKTCKIKDIKVGFKLNE